MDLCNGLLNQEQKKLLNQGHFHNWCFQLYWVLL